MKTKDMHGYEIWGLSDATTKNKKLQALNNHLSWLENRELDVRRDIKNKIIELENK